MSREKIAWRLLTAGMCWAVFSISFLIIGAMILRADHFTFAVMPYFLLVEVWLMASSVYFLYTSKL